MPPTSQLPKQFLIRFRAASLHLETCEPAKRTLVSAEQTKLLITMLNEGNSLSRIQHDELVELVLSTEKGWEKSDRSALIEALSKRLEGLNRRNHQEWIDNVYDVFTAEEWARWKNAGSTGMMQTLEQILGRMKSLGGKNLCEYTKKALTAVWLHLRGDGLTIDRMSRHVAKLRVNSEWTKLTRHFEPEIYLETLDIANLKHECPRLFTLLSLC